MSDTQADTATTTEAATGTEGATADTDTVTVDHAAEAEKWKALAQKHETRAKANADAAKELETLKRDALPEAERKIAEALDQGKVAGAAEATAKLAARLVDAEVKAAAAGRNVDVDALLEGLDRTRFLTDDGDADTTAIAAWVDRIAPKPDPDAQAQAALSGFVDLGQGARPAGSEALNGDPLLRDLKSKLGIG